MELGDGGLLLELTDRLVAFDRLFRVVSGVDRLHLETDRV